jgi:hypothetical protein
MPIFIVIDSDNEKFLRVVAGRWGAQTIPNAEGRGSNG